MTVAFEHRLAYLKMKYNKRFSYILFCKYLVYLYRPVSKQFTKEDFASSTMFFSLLLNIGLLVLIATMLTKIPVYSQHAAG